MEFFGSIRLARLARTTDQCAVGSDGLACSGRRQHRPQVGEVFEAGNYFLNARYRDMNARNTSTEAAVSLVGGEGDKAAIGHEKVGARDAHFGGKEGPAQLAASRGNQLRRIIAMNVLPQLFAEQF